MNLIERRISDKKVLKLKKQWLKAGVLEEGEIRVREKGASQGGLCGARHKEPYAEIYVMWR